MPEINVAVYPHNQAQIALSEGMFGCEYKEGLIHQVVTAYMAAARAGTKAQKTRSQVSGGGAKPWRQKGTGRARAGTIRSPIWRKGGKTFAAVNRSYEQKVNRKMYRKAIASILSQRLREEALHVIDGFEVNDGKTKSCVKLMADLGMKGSSNLLVVDQLQPSLALSSRNLVNLTVIDVKEINPYDLVKHSALYVTISAVKLIQGDINES